MCHEGFEPLNHSMIQAADPTLRPNTSHGLLVVEVSRSHTTTHHSR
jgi:hypothetical protein